LNIHHAVSALHFALPSNLSITAAVATSLCRRVRLSLPSRGPTNKLLIRIAVRCIASRWLCCKSLCRRRVSSLPVFHHRRRDAAPAAVAPTFSIHAVIRPWPSSAIITLRAGCIPLLPSRPLRLHLQSHSALHFRISLYSLRYFITFGMEFAR
jgi:hypothetical protein